MVGYRNPRCERCPLKEGVASVCVPMERVGDATTQKHDRALYIIGEAPGVEEDQACRPFIGRSGKLLRACYINYFDFPSKLDVYIGNAVRCRPPENAKPGKTQVKDCHLYMLHDLMYLQARYKEVIILAVGSTGVLAATGIDSLKKAFGKQGAVSDFSALASKTKKYYKQYRQILKRLRPSPVFSTYHPAALLRDPSRAPSNEAHLRLLNDYLDGKVDVEISGPIEITEAPSPPSYDIAKLSLDIETYGLIIGAPVQTQFHPHKSVTYDGVAKEKQIYTTGITWRDPDQKEHHGIFLLQNAAHRRRLWTWIRKIRDYTGGTIVGQNLPYDVMYLRYCYPECRVWLDVGLPLCDLMIINYLHDEGRPEKSLKDLAPLMRVTEYEIEGAVKRFKSDRDPDLWYYNCQDTFATLRLVEILEERIKEFYGKDTEKLSPFCRKWYSDLLWLIIRMCEEGVAMDHNYLSKLFERRLRASQGLMDFAKEKWGLIMRGKGSQTSKNKVILEAVDRLEELDLKCPKLAVTDKTKAISIKEENRNALIDVLPKGDEHYLKLRTLNGYQRIGKELDSYLYPLLVGRGKKHNDPSTLLIDGIAYPRWYPVPASWEGDSEGGTKQARIVASGPALQTLPPSIKRAICCRFPGGVVLWFDYSQIELRIAALLSNDRAMMKEYSGSPDLHGATAQLIFGESIVNHPEYKSRYRQAGKVVNFLMLYRGQWRKLKATLMTNTGIDYPDHLCREAIRKFWKRHDGLWEWQESLISSAKERGFIELPLIGQSRLFLGSAYDVKEAEREIVNLPVQAISANITISAQIEYWQTLRDNNLRSIVPVNVYDAAATEVRKGELYACQKLLHKVLPCPPYYHELTKRLGRSLPLEYEIKISQKK